MTKQRTKRLPNSLLLSLVLLPLLSPLLGQRTQAASPSAALAGTSTQGTGQLTLPEIALGEDRQIVHALNRLGFGPRPGDVSRVRRVGVAAYIEQQLAPETIDDADLERRLRPLTSLSMTTPERLAAFPPRQLLAAVARQLGSRLTPDERARLLPELGQNQPRESRSDRRSAKNSDPRDLAVRKEARQVAPGPRVISDELAQARLLRAIYSDRQLQEVMTDFWFNHFNVYVGKGAVRWWATDYEQSAIRPHAMGSFRDLLGAVARHPAMLFYLDNWLSSSTEGGIDARSLNYHAMDGIYAQRLPPGGLGTLLLRQRGMDTHDLERRIARRDSRRRQNRATRGEEPSMEGDPLPGRAGLNENYARELLELHTLGVDGGYTQADIVAVARCFSGWSLLPLYAGQSFAYIEQLHAAGPKTVLGQRIEERGRLEGEAVLDLLARHPSTARFISTKLARRFVGDDPSAALIGRMARTFTETDGDIREVLRKLFVAPEFWAPQAWRAKVKTPFEFVVSAARALAAEVTVAPARESEATTMGMSVAARSTGAEEDSEPDAGSPRPWGAQALARTLHGMGQPLYGCQPPTGYKDRAEAWVSAGALMHRMKFSMGLAANRLAGVDTDVSAGLAGGKFDDDTITALNWRLTGEYPRPAMVRVIRDQLELSADDLQQLGLPPGFNRSPRGAMRIAAGWILASPEFQRR